jgi:hypothetical protein
VVVLRLSVDLINPPGFVPAFKWRNMKTQMWNKRMQEKLNDGSAMDVSGCELTDEGDYILTDFEEGVDYCDAKTEKWIWSIGKDRTTGVILASTSDKYYQNPDFECL